MCTLSTGGSCVGNAAPPVDIRTTSFHCDPRCDGQATSPLETSSQVCTRIIIMNTTTSLTLGLYWHYITSMIHALYITYFHMINNGVLLKGRWIAEQVSKTLTFSFHNRWANPIYLGAYSAGLFTTLGCYALALDPQTPLLSLLVLSLVCFHLILFYKLVTGECCPKWLPAHP